MSWDKWPFYPLTLTEAFDPKEAKARNLLRLIVSGSSERLQRALTVVEPQYTQDGKREDSTNRVDHVNPKEHFALFCEKMRELKLFDAKCIICDRELTLKLIKGVLFSIEEKFQSDLDNGSISEGLQQEFKNNEFSLSQNATILVKEKGGKWLINDNEQTYTVRKEENKLTIYNERQLEQVHRYKCIHKLIDYACPVIIDGRIVAVAFTGQFLPNRDDKTIKLIRRAALKVPGVKGKYSWNNVNNLIKKLDTEEEYFKRYKEWAIQNKFELPTGVDEKDGVNASKAIFENTIKQFGQIAEAQFRLHKRDREREFFEQLRELFPTYALPLRNDVQEIANKALEKVKEYWGVDWIVLFCSPHQFISVPANPSLLEFFASAGVLQEILDGIMHFNWRKAGFPTRTERDKTQALKPLIIGDSNESKHQLERGLRGPKKEDLLNATLLFPAFLSENYRAVIIVGPFDRDKNVQISNEIHCLQDVADLIASKTFSQLEMIDFDDDHRRWTNIATNLMHTSRRAIQPITVGREIIQSHFDDEGVYSDEDIKDALSSLQTATEIMATDVRRPIEVIAAWVEGQYNFQPASLAEIAKRCAKLYSPIAREREVTIIVEDNIHALPEIEMDITKIQVTLENLLDNAIKYCHRGTEIHIGGRQRGYYVEVYVDDFGLGIDDEDLDRIFNIGFQGARSKKAIGKEGDGFGLYHAKTVVTVHGGDIGAECRTGQRSAESKPLEGYRVIVTMKLPINQPER